MPAHPSVAIYDAVADGDSIYPGFFSGEYMNFGLWDADTRDRTAASDNLMRAIASNMSTLQHPVLDVACGLGATTRYLAGNCQGRRVYATNASPRQLLECRVRCAEAPCVAMDGAAMAIAANTIGDVVCVEAAFHFNTRVSFLRDAWRVLRPGGRVLLTDILLNPDGHQMLPHWRSCNFLPDLTSYSDLVSDVGFAQVHIRDITSNGIAAYLAHMRLKVAQDRERGLCDPDAHRRATRTLAVLDTSYSWNLLCVAVK